MALDLTLMTLRLDTHRSTTTGSSNVFGTDLPQLHSTTRPDRESALGFVLAGTVAIPFFPLDMVTGPAGPAFMPRASLLPTGMWHPIADYIQASPAHKIGSIWQQQLARIKDDLKITITDLARFLLVERPSVYQWFAYTEPRKRNLVRINALADLAMDWAGLDLGSIRPYLDYRSSNGKFTLAELLLQQPLPSRAIEQLFRQLSHPPVQIHTDVQAQVVRSSPGTGS